MRKSTLLKIAMTLTAMFLISGVFAQTNTGSTQWSAAGGATVGDFARSNATPITNAADALVTSPTDKITIGKAMPFFVWPSAAYNPNWDYTAVTGAAAGAYTPITDIVTNVPSDFAWVSAGSTLTPFYSDGTSTDDGNGIKNYVEISWATTGNKVIQVTETPASGVCAAVPVYMGVNVIAVPTAAVTGAGVELGLNNVIQRACWAVANDNATAIDFTFPAADAALQEYPFNFNVTYEVFNVTGLDGAGELPNAAGVFNDADASVSDITLTTTVHINGQDGTNHPSDANPIIVAAGTQLVASQDYPVQNNMITVYRVTYDGVNSRISRKSDYIDFRNNARAANAYASYSYYPAVAANVAKYIVALPTPVTGPIYHIANNFAY